MNDETQARWAEFATRMHEIRDLDGVLNLLGWDEETSTPPAGREARGRQTATIEAVRHQRLVEPALGEQMAVLLEAGGLSLEREQMVRRLQRRRDLATRVPEKLVRSLAEARSRSLEAWQRARTARDFPAFKPHLEEMVRLLRAKADALGTPPGGERYDALLDEHEPGMVAARLRPVLERLRQGLVPLVEAILGKPRRPAPAFLEGRSYPLDAQWALTVRVLRDLGFDLERGRQDRSAHPFTCSCAETDVRLTTRLLESNPLSALYSTIHECGHGLYEQGFPAAWHRTTLAEAPSMGIHESQSRLWENQVGRSRAFWAYCRPLLSEAFPGQAGQATIDELYRWVNTVAASPIRVEADEVTYNLHILLRFELEQALLSGDLPVADLPAAWAEKMPAYLGIAPQDDAEGCLQDIHWAWGAIGYFPTYTLGNLWAAQLMAAYERERPQVWEDIAGGRFAPLLAWLRAGIHQKGHLASAADTVKAVTGTDLDTGALLDYLRAKYGELYRL